MASDSRYVLLTAARNEEITIGQTIRSIGKQTCLPLKWIIVSDGSIDGTENVVTKHKDEFPFIKLIRKEIDLSQKGFTSKVLALQLGYSAVKSEVFDFIGHLDADITLHPEYFQSIFARFDEDSELGLAGGFIHEMYGDRFVSRRTNSLDSVAGAIQMFRRKCYDDIGEILPLEWGGEDWYAEVRARMAGWRVRAFPDLSVCHHKKSSQVRGMIPELYRAGLMDFSIGSHPIFEVIKCFRRMVYSPAIISGLIRLLGYSTAVFRHDCCMVSDNFKSYLRREQMERVRRMFHLEKNLCA